MNRKITSLLWVLFCASMATAATAQERPHGGTNRFPISDSLLVIGQTAIDSSGWMIRGGYHEQSDTTKTTRIGIRYDPAGFGANAAYWHTDQTSGVSYWVFSSNSTAASQVWLMRDADGTPAYGGFNLSSTDMVMWAGASPGAKNLSIAAATGNASFTNDLSVTGALSKGSGSFLIDHPLDPLNYELRHSFVESPDMMNIYNGNIELDKYGEIWIRLPEYFAALNMDFKYQLTAIGQPMPKLYIASKANGNLFKIAGGVPGGEVSWQITGIRKDRFAIMNPVQVIRKKRMPHYIHPKAFR